MRLLPSLAFMSLSVHRSRSLMPFMAPLLALSPLRDIFFTYCYYPSYGMRAHVLYEHVDPYGPIISRDAYMRTYGRKDAIATRLPRTGAVVLVDRVPLLDEQACADAKCCDQQGDFSTWLYYPLSRLHVVASQLFRSHANGGEMRVDICVRANSPIQSTLIATT